MKSVDEFIDYGSDNPEPNENYARWVLNYFRMPATMQFAFEEFMKDNLLFCEYEGSKWRVTGASRFGDVWLTKDFKQSHGYSDRVEISLCYNWSKE